MYAYVIICIYIYIKPKASGNNLPLANTGLLEVEIDKKTRSVSNAGLFENWGYLKTATLKGKVQIHDQPFRGINYYKTI